MPKRTTEDVANALYAQFLSANEFDEQMETAEALMKFPVLKKKMHHHQKSIKRMDKP